MAETTALWPQESCPHCGHQTVRGHDHAPELRWWHLNVCQLQSEIVCALPRGECQECRKIWCKRRGWPQPGLTQEFVAFALTLMREMPVKTTREILAGAVRACGSGLAGFELTMCCLTSIYVMQKEGQIQVAVTCALLDLLNFSTRFHPDEPDVRAGRNV